MIDLVQLLPCVNTDRGGPRRNRGSLRIDQLCSVLACGFALMTPSGARFLADQPPRPNSHAARAEP
jgi:hypothetical protein